MDSVDPAVIWRMRPLLQRVLIVDSNAHAASLLNESLTALGAQEVFIQADPDVALRAAGTLAPTLIVTEAIADADPFGLVRSIRRSSMACRQAPVVVLTTLATVSGIRLAKDAGAHEYMRKPFSRSDLVRRLDHLASRPRPWVEKPGYIGPDRRTFNSGGAIRRLSDRLELIERGVPPTSLYLAR